MSGHARHHGHARALRGGARRRLAAHEGDDVGGRPDEGQTGFLHRPRELFVLREKTIAGVNGVGAGTARRIDDAIDAEVAVARCARPDQVGLVGEADMKRRPIALGVHSHRRQAHLPARAHHANGDLAAVRNQNFFHNSVRRRDLENVFLTVASV